MLTTLALTAGLSVTASPAHAEGPNLIYNIVTHKCVDIPGFGTGALNGPVNQYTCDDTWYDNQFFYRDLASNASGQYTIRNAKDNLCLDVPYYGAVAPGTKVSEYYCNGTTSDNQLYYSVPIQTGVYEIKNVASGLCLDVAGFRTGGNDARLTLYYCNINDDHLWRFL